MESGREISVLDEIMKFSEWQLLKVADNKISRMKGEKRG